MSVAYCDLETERRIAACAFLIGHPHPLFGVLSPDDFYLGVRGFHGWLFRVIRSGVNQRHGLTIDWLLSAIHRRESRRLGVLKLSHAVASLMFGADGMPRDYDPAKWQQYAATLIAVRAYRERQDRISQAAMQLERDWGTRCRHLEYWTMAEHSVLVIVLPLPPKELHPNFHKTGWQAAMSKKKKARLDAGYATKAAITAQGVKGLPWKSATFEAAFKLPRLRDDDGLVSWLKAYRDGIADAGVVADDFNFHVQRPTQVVEKGGREVVITLRRIE